MARAAASIIAPPSPLVADTRPRSTVARRDRIYRLALLVADLAAGLMVVGLGAEWLGTAGPNWSALLLLALVPPVNAANGLYARDEQVLHKSTLDEAPRIFQAATLVTILIFLIESAAMRMPIGGTVITITWLGLAVTVPACRTLARALLRGALTPERCLVLGTHESGRRLAAKLTPEAGVEAQLVGVMPLTLEQAAGDPGAVATPERIARAIDELEVHRVVVAGDTAPQAELDAIQAAKSLGVKVSVLPRVLEVVGSAATYDYVDGMTILSVPRFGLGVRARLVKRAFDVAGSTLLLVVAAPLMAVMALAVKLTSPGPVLFKQTRIGRDGRPFAMLKFRSMRENAEAVKDQLRHRNEAAAGLFKIADDPRITRVGRVLRRTSLDELPQLLNVIAGEMSLVGPRPLIPEEDRQIHGWHRRRLHLTPGMTGPWQVLGSARIPLREMVTIDYLYVAHWSLWDDFKILLRTAGTVVGRRGLK